MMSGKKLLDSGSESDEEPSFDSKSKEFKINESYAESYNRFREKEVYQRLKDKYGEDAAKKSIEEDLEDNEDSDSESEDEDAEALTEQVEKDFFKTLAMLKTKDPRIYDGKTTFYEEGKSGQAKEAKAGSSKAMTIGDLQRKVILEKEGKFDEMSDEKLFQKSQGKTYVQEMEELKDAFKKDDSDDDEDDILKPREKTVDEKAKEEDDYRTWLAGQSSNLEDKEVEGQLGGLRSYWNSKGLSKDEKFLRDYILNRKYLGNEDDQDEAGDEEEEGHADDLEEDEAMMRNQEEFETKYNFRFQEPDAEFIKRYPRTMADTMKKKDNTRKRKREEAKAKKEEEKSKQREELKQLKVLKRKEIVDKIRKLEKVAGADMAFKEEDLDDDFDPAEYDKRMAAVFEHYDETAAAGADDEKPEWSDMSDIDEDMETENWDEWEGGGEQGKEKQKEEDSEESEDEDLGEGTSKASKKELAKQLAADQVRNSSKKMSKFERAVTKAKPVFDPTDKTFQEYLDEYYGLDYEDAIGDLKCRFKYRNVEASGFGLSTEEILSAPDRELNAWCSLKKTCQYRSADEERRDFQEYERKGKNLKFKQKVMPSLFKEDAEEDLEAEREKKAKKSRKRKRKNKDEGEDPADSPAKKPAEEKSGKEPSKKDEQNEKEPGEEPSKKKRKRNKGKGKKSGGDSSDVINKTILHNKKPSGDNKKPSGGNVNAEIKMSDDRLKAYGLVPNQYKRKVKKAKYIKK